jgi:signal transduction histidine kinase
LRILNQRDKNGIREPIEHILTLSQSALAEMREHLYHLHPTALEDEDLLEALTQYCGVISKRYDLKIEFEVDLELSLTSVQQDALYYVVREALWNIVKHALAKHVEITVKSGSNRIILTIADDGVGFDPSIVGTESMGLRNIQERARMLRGLFELHSEPGQGTRLVFQFPIQLG